MPDGAGSYIDAARKQEPTWQGSLAEFKTITLQELLLLRRNKCRLQMIVLAQGQGILRCELSTGNARVVVGRLNN